MIWYICAFYAIHSLSLFCLGENIIYFPCAWVILTLCHHNIYVWILFLFIVYMCLYWWVCVFYTIYSLVLLYLGGLVIYIYPVHGLSYHWIIVTSSFLFIFMCKLYLCLQLYDFVIYTIYSMFVFRLGVFYLYIYSIKLIPPVCCHPFWPEFIISD